MKSCYFVRVLAAASAFVACAIPAGAIEIADGFTYAGESGFTASHALATDFNNYPVFGAVGSLNIHLQGGAVGTGSATLLNNEWVLTAGHCWSSNVTSYDFVLGGVPYAADMTSLTVHPLWKNAPPPLADMTAGTSQGWDLALFKLAAPITGNLTFPELYTKSDELGKAAVTLGAGDLGTGTVPWYEQSSSPPLVHAAFNVIDRVTSQTWTTNATDYGGGFLVTDFDGSTDPDQNTLDNSYHPGGDPWLWDGNSTITALDPAGGITGASSSSDQYLLDADIVEGAPAPGDSGGPTFILDTDGKWKLAGVTSWGNNPWDELYNGGSGFRGLYGDVNYMVRISEASDWIYSVIPEPSSAALLLLGASVLCLTRTRRKV